MSWLGRLRRILTTRSKPAVPSAERGGRGAGPQPTGPRPSPRSASVDPRATQFAGYLGGAANRDTTDLVVGLDFGTVCTKAVIRSPYVAGERATAVEWPDGDPRGPCLLPTALCGTNGRFELAAPKSRPEQAHRDLKVRLMDQPSSAVARARAAAYLGLALRAARQWFLETQRGVYGRFELRWALNLGIPSAGYDDEQVREAFTATGQAAWRLSLSPDPPTLESATAALAATQARADSGTGLDSIPEVEVIPEIVAEVVGYARSRRRRDGLHVMVDVGGSTVDVCGFVLHAPADGDGDRYALLTAVVAPLGLRELHLRRVRAVERAGKRLRAAVGCDPSPFDAIPAAGRSYVDDPAAGLRVALDDIDKQYASECKTAIMRVLMGLRKRDRLARNFRKGLPVFIGGGGGRFGLVGEALEECDALLKSVLVDAGGVRPGYLPALEGLSNRALRGETAGRLDAALGLSYDRPDVGTIIRPEDIDDPRPPPEVGRPESVGKEHV